jgi:DNA repair protein RecO (recombination protein O)
MRGDHLYRTEAIVLRRMDYGETDRILTLFTRGYGKVRAMAKGVRKINSRKSGHVELFTRVDILLAQGRSFEVVSQAEMVEAYLPLRSDLVRSTYAGHFVELLDAFTEDSDQHDDLYWLLSRGLQWLCATEDLRRTARYYEIQMLSSVGFQPQLNNCIICDTVIKPENQFYSVVDGGVVCPDCAPDVPRARSLSLNALKVLRYMQRSTFEAIDKLTISAPVHLEIERILYDTLIFHLERRLKSATFLERLRREETH